MIEDFPLLQQRPGSNSCLPVAVTAILQHFGENVTEEQVSEWCGESRDGCVIDFAMQGLRDQDYEVLEIADDPETRIREYLNDEDNPLPVLVTIMPAFSDVMDHAVVLVGITTDAAGEEVINLMDSLCGCIQTMSIDEFFRQWDNAGQLAFLITT